MSYKLLIKLDFIIGGLLCFIFSFIAKFKNFKYNESSNLKHILIIKFWGLGSISLTIPLIYALKKNTKAKLTFLTFDTNKDLFIHIDCIDNVVKVRNNNFFAFFVDSINAFNILTKNKPSIIFDLEFLSRYTSILTFLIGSPKRCGFKSLFNFQNSLYTDTIIFNPKKHISFNFYQMISTIGLKLDEDYLSDFYNFKIKFDKNIENNVINKFQLPEKYIVINPNSSFLCMNRRWLPDYFINLIKQLKNKYNFFYFIFIGSNKEIKYSENITNILNDKYVINITGLTTLSDLLVVIKNATLLISNDSGPLHLASLFQKKSISFYGPETPSLYGPINKNNISFYDFNLKCSPCIDIYKYKYCDCNNNLCMKLITPEKVLPIINNILGEL